MTDLFEASGTLDDTPRPLADRLRPQTLAAIVGQDHLVGTDGSLTQILASGIPPSIILWGPPGCGKTSIARLLAGETGLAFEQISAIFSGVSDLKKIFEAARLRRRAGQGTLLFVDEIHRFNRAQQDSFLPVVEDGTVTLVGATTENPSFEVNAALLSRMRVLTLKALGQDAFDVLAKRTADYYGEAVPLTDAGFQALMRMADGDGRYFLGALEQIYAAAPDTPMDTDALSTLLQARMPSYDKDRDGHYNLISALHKSLRGSDPDAALYWCARMLVAGEDPLYVLRRLVRFASEDVGLADPDALRHTLAARDAYQFLGSPEGDLAIAQAVLYLALAPKSNAAYGAHKAATKAARATGSVPPPKHILNAPTKLMKQEGYGEGYAYDHDSEHGFSGQNYFPDDMPRASYYQPVERGFEREMKKRLDWFEKRRRELTQSE